MKNIQYITGLFVAALLFTNCIRAEEKKVELKLELPKAFFQGTPVPVKLPNMEAPNTPAMKIMVPEGTTNLAKGKKVTSSDSAPVIGELEMITNGDKEATDGCYTELGPSLQWAQVDLGAKHTIYAIAFWHYHAQPRAYHDVVVQISNDPDFVTDVKTVYNNDHDNSAGMGIGTDKAYIEANTGRLIDTKGVVGRYVRLYSRGNTSNEMNHYIEVEIFGTPEMRK